MDVRRTFSVSVRLSNDLIKSSFVVSPQLRAALRAELARLDSNFDVHCHPVSWRGRQLAVSSRWSKDRMVIELGVWPAGMRPVTIVGRAGPRRTP